MRVLFNVLFIFCVSGETERAEIERGDIDSLKKEKRRKKKQ